MPVYIIIMLAEKQAMKKIYLSTEIIISLKNFWAALIRLFLFSSTFCPFSSLFGQNHFFSYWQIKKTQPTNSFLSQRTAVLVHSNLTHRKSSVKIKQDIVYVAISIKINADTFCTILTLLDQPQMIPFPYTLG